MSAIDGDTSQNNVVEFQGDREEQAEAVVRAATERTVGLTHWNFEY